ncbi:MAG: redoxin domain-containing protein [Thermodesulfobacteriota bacterium]
MIEQFQFLLQESFRQDSISLYFLMFGGGLLASVTPCTYPVLPLTVGYIGNMAGADRWKAFSLSITMVFGMAFVYAILGSIVAAVGGTFGSIMGNGWALYAIAMYFLIMGLFLLDVFSFPVPELIAGLQAKWANRGGMFGAFVQGGVSGLICGPCTGPLLAVAFGAMAITLEELRGVAYALQILKGGVLLFLFGIGQGALILLAGISTGFISRLPKAGAWMEALKKGFALMIIVAATLLFVLVGQNTDFPNLIQLLATTETAAVPAEAPLASPAVLPPAVATDGVTSPKPLASPAPEYRATEKPLSNPAPDFTLPSLEGAQVTLSQFRGQKGVVLVFFATWCVACIKELPENIRFAEAARKDNVVVLGINYKQSKETVERLRKSEQITYPILLDEEGTVTGAKYGIRGLPHIVGISAKGEIVYRGVSLPEKRGEFIKNLKQGL